MDLNEEDRKSLESFDTNLTGSELEEKFFNNLQQVMEKSKIKDTLNNYMLYIIKNPN